MIVVMSHNCLWYVARFNGPWKLPSWSTRLLAQYFHYPKNKYFKIMHKRQKINKIYQSIFFAYFPTKIKIFLHSLKNTKNNNNAVDLTWLATPTNGFHCFHSIKQNANDVVWDDFTSIMKDARFHVLCE